MKINIFRLFLFFLSASTVAMDHNRLPKPDFSKINNKKRKRQGPPPLPRKIRQPRKLVNKNLFKAAQNNNLDEVKCFLAQGENPNKAVENDGLDQGKTPLLIAAKKGYVQIVACLLHAGADPNQEIIDGYDKDTTPLCWAVERASKKEGKSRSNYIQIIKLLLSRKAQVDSLNNCLYSELPDEYVTPLWIAVESSDLKVVKLLLEYGADVNKAPFGGRNRNVTPVYMAAFYGHIGMLYYLLKPRYKKSFGKKAVTLQTLQRAYDAIRVSRDNKHKLSAKVLRYRYLIEQLTAQYPDKKIEFEKQFDAYVYTQLMDVIVLSGKIIGSEEYDLIKEFNAEKPQKRTLLDNKTFAYLEAQFEKQCKKDISLKDKELRESCWDALLHINVFKGKFADDLFKLRDRQKEEEQFMCGVCPKCDTEWLAQTDGCPECGYSTGLGNGFNVMDHKYFLPRK